MFAREPASLPDGADRPGRTARRWVTGPRLALVAAAALVSVGWAWPTTAAATTVRVSPGATLTQIARIYATTVDALVAANGIGDPDQIQAGTVLQVPTGAPSSGAASATSGYTSSGTGGTITVTVANGDTLWSIASRYGSSVATIADANGITDPSHVEVGVRIVVPEPLSDADANGSDGDADGTANVPLLSSQVQRSSLPAGLLAHPSRLALQALFARWATEFGVPESLLEALCWWESGWQMGVVSSTGAMGVGQLEPSTVANLRLTLGQPGLQATNTSDNIEMAAAYLHQLLVATGDNESQALAGYYQGIPSVQHSGMFPSTVQYVHGILAFANLFA